MGRSADGFACVGREVHLNVTGGETSIVFTEAGLLTGCEPLTVLTHTNLIAIDGKDYSLTSFQDITQRKRAEEALRENERRLRLSLQAGNIGLWDWNLETNDVYFSPEWKSQIGYWDERF
jgi:PAS domain-containing protein